MIMSDNAIRTIHSVWLTVIPMVREQPHAIPSVQLIDNILIDPRVGISHLLLVHRQRLFRESVSPESIEIEKQHSRIVVELGVEVPTPEVALEGSPPNIETDSRVKEYRLIEGKLKESENILIGENVNVQIKGDSLGDKQGKKEPTERRE
jgi:hypothetical protein